VLGAVTRPALFLGSGGEVLRTNAEGRKLLHAGGGALKASLATGVAKDSKLWYLVPLRTAGGLLGYLAFFRPLPLAVHKLDADDAVHAAARAWSLSARKRQVLQLVARGLPNSIVADMLRIAERTVEFHLSGIFDKAGVESRASLIARLFGT
jgi:DNA-binding NarL/FixJ family response regulator